MSKLELRYHLTQDAMHSAFNQLTAWLRVQELQPGIVFKMRVIAEELMSNVVRHGEQGAEDEAFVTVEDRPTEVVFTLVDTGIPFNPIENREQGYGLMIANGAATEINYNYEEGKNVTSVKVKK